MYILTVCALGEDAVIVSIANRGKKNEEPANNSHSPPANAYSNTITSFSIPSHLAQPSVVSSSSISSLSSSPPTNVSTRHRSITHRSAANLLPLPSHTPATPSSNMNTMNSTSTFVEDGESEDFSWGQTMVYKKDGLIGMCLIVDNHS